MRFKADFTCKVYLKCASATSRGFFDRNLFPEMNLVSIREEQLFDGEKPNLKFENESSTCLAFATRLGYPNSGRSG
jgi:hypothetical protein